MLYLKDKNN